MQDKDHWKKETAARVRDTKERMQKLTENQLETLTKRTILENEQMDAEMRYQSRQVGLDGRVVAWPAAAGVGKLGAGGMSRDGAPLVHVGFRGLYLMS